MLNPWRIVNMLLLPIILPVSFLCGVFFWLADKSEAWDLRERQRAVEDLYAPPEMRQAWTCGCGYHNEVGPVMLPNGDRVPATMCGRCGGDRL